MDSYRERGLYDNSLIIVASDHGLDQVPSVGGYPPSASAMLWVKAEGAGGPMRISDRRTSHSLVSALVKTALKRKIAADEVVRLLESSSPLYRAEEPGSHGKFVDTRMEKSE